VLDDDVALVNDTGREWAGELVLARRGLDGAVLAEQRQPVTVPARSVHRVPLPAPVDPTNELLTASLDGQRLVHLSAEDPQVAYPPAAFTATTERVDDGLLVHITAQTLLRELALFPDRLDPDATVDEQLVTVLPGECVTFHVRGAADLDPAALTAYPVLRCVNESRP
jgi:beta-mannosidase